jgi:hypothetical protein
MEETMTNHPKFLGFGLLVLTGLTGLQWYGFGTVNANELKNVPKTIRDNPGVWRSHYGYSPRYMGGK